MDPKEGMVQVGNRIDVGIEGITATSQSSYSGTWITVNEEKHWIVENPATGQVTVYDDDFEHAYPATGNEVLIGPYVYSIYKDNNSVYTFTSQGLDLFGAHIRTVGFDEAFEVYSEALQEAVYLESIGEAIERGLIRRLVVDAHSGSAGRYWRRLLEEVMGLEEGRHFVFLHEVPEFLRVLKGFIDGAADHRGLPRVPMGGET